MPDTVAAVHAVRFRHPDSSNRALGDDPWPADGVPLDGAVVTVAVPRIRRIWVAQPGHLTWSSQRLPATLGALVLVGGSLGDLLGIRRVFGWGWPASP